MINLFFTSTQSPGPKKVAQNTIKGFQKLDAKHSNNKEVFDNNVMLHFDENKYELLKNKSRTLIGPNVWLFDSPSPLLKDNRYCKIIVPSKWVADLLISKLNLNEERILEWPVGIDTESFNVAKNVQFDCLIYFKRRKEEELNHIKQILKDAKQSFNTLVYGNYTENEFLDLLSKCRYSVVVDNTESQGIAIEEIMSTNTPMFVWDVDAWLDLGEDFRVPATSVPYWSDECGIKTCDIESIPDLFDKFISTLGIYTPRQYVIDNLEMSKQSKKLLESFYVN